MLALVALGQSLVIIAWGAGIDLSVGGTMSLSAILAMMTVHEGLPSALTPVAPVAVGNALGTFNGAYVKGFRVPQRMATLATLLVYAGLAMA